MKKIATIAFAGFYFLAAIGVAVNIHYCMGQFGNINIYAEASPCCCGDKEMEKDCCDDSSFFFQIDQDQKVNKNYRISGPELFTYLFLSTVNFQIEPDQVKSDQFIVQHPILYEQPVWLLNCSLTYYG